MKPTTVDQVHEKIRQFRMDTGYDPKFLWCGSKSYINLLWELIPARVMRDESPVTSLRPRFMGMVVVMDRKAPMDDIKLGGLRAL